MLGCKASTLMLCGVVVLHDSIEGLSQRYFSTITSLASCSTLFAAAVAAALQMYGAMAAAMCSLLLPNCEGSHTVHLLVFIFSCI